MIPSVYSNKIPCVHLLNLPNTMPSLLDLLVHHSQLTKNSQNSLKQFSWHCWLQQSPFLHLFDWTHNLPSYRRQDSVVLLDRTNNFPSHRHQDSVVQFDRTNNFPSHRRQDSVVLFDRTNNLPSHRHQDSVVLFDWTPNFPSHRHLDYAFLFGRTNKFQSHIDQDSLWVFLTQHKGYPTWKVIPSHRHQCAQTASFEEKGEPKRIRTEVPLLTSLTPLPLGQTGSQND